MSLASKVAKNTFYQIIGKAASILLGLATVALMTRYLGRQGFGYYTIVVSYLQFFGVLVDFGLQMTTAQMLSRPGADQAKIFGNILTIRLLSALVFLGGGALLVWLLPYDQEVKIGVAIAAFSFFFIALQSVLIGLYQKHLAMAEVALAEVWGRVALLVGVYLSFSLDWGFYPIIAAISLSSFINFFLLFIKSRKYVAYRLEFDCRMMKEIWEVSWPLAITISLTLVYFRADTIILSFFRSAEDVGIYGAAYKVLEILVQFPYLFLGLILPLLSEFYLLNRELFQKTFQKSFDFLAILALPMVFGCWLLSEKIISFVAGTDFMAATLPLRILIVAVMMIYFGSLFGYAIVATGRQKKMIGFYLFDAVFSLAAYLLFIPLYGYVAAAILTVVTEAIITFSAYYLIRREAQVQINPGVFLKALTASVLMCLALYPFLNQNILTLVIIGALIYFTCLYLLKGYDKKEVLSMLKLK